MIIVTPEEANEWISKLSVEEDRPKLLPGFLELKTPPLSWAEFLAMLVQYCNYRNWEIDYDSAEDMSCAIFGHEEPPDSRYGLSDEELIAFEQGELR